MLNTTSKMFSNNCSVIRKQGNVDLSSMKDISWLCNCKFKHENSLLWNFDHAKISSTVSC